jgi:hypothetical protein
MHFAHFNGAWFPVNKLRKGNVTAENKYLYEIHLCTSSRQLKIAGPGSDLINGLLVILIA